ncbi:MAG: hypothetical protein Q8P71_02695 [bacterium]|nr:hypothetical protein [bacterium]
MLEFFGSIFLILSALALGYLLGRKIPILLSYPRYEGNLILQVKDRIVESVRSSRAYGFIASPETAAQRVLSQTRVAMLRAESRVGSLLEKVRARAKNKKENEGFNDSYWQNLKKGVGRIKKRGEQVQGEEREVQVMLPKQTDQGQLVSSLDVVSVEHGIEKKEEKKVPRKRSKKRDL